MSYVFAVVKDNARPKFSFHSHAHGEKSSKISDMAEYFEPPDDDQAAIEEDPIAECPNDSDEISDNTEDAVSMLLIPPPDKIRVTKRSSKSVNFSFSSGLAVDLLLSLSFLFHSFIGRLFAPVQQAPRKMFEICS